MSRSRIAVIAAVVFVLALTMSYTIAARIAEAAPCQCGVCFKYCCATGVFEPAKFLAGNCTSSCNFTLDCPCGPCP